MMNQRNNKTYEKPLKTKESILFDLNIGVLIKKYRNAFKQKGNPLFKLTQAKLGNVINVTFQQIQKYEKGQNTVPPYKLMQIAKFLNFDVGYAITSSANNEHYPNYLLENKVIAVSYKSIAEDKNLILSPKYWIEKIETNKNK
mgnify:CR=1 FL=1